MREEKSFCRICSGGCGVNVTIDDDDRISKVRSDPDHPMTRGYACFKGLQAAASHHGPARLLNPMKHMPNGSFQQISSEQALDEIGDRLGRIIGEHGPDAAGLFQGNGATSFALFSMIRSFLQSFGSRQLFTTMTIDQSAKYVSFERLGGWAGGAQDFDTMDVVMMFGANPLISHAAIGLLCVDPVKRLKEACARGLKVIAIDPRRTETAHHAELFLQPLPGHDTAIAASIIRTILAEGWEDADFCARFVGAERMADLRAAVAPFAPETTEERAGLVAGQIRAAARMFARDGRRGVAMTGTGPNMAPHSNVGQHLIDTLNVICGRFPREGERLTAIDVLSPPPTYREEVISAPRSWTAYPPSRIRGFGTIAGERMSGTLADEILTPGSAQIRALFVVGANPAISMPDQVKMVEALKSLDLLVSIDPFRTPTARLAHYIIPPTMFYERADLPISFPGIAFYPVAWTQYARPLVKPPAGSDVVEDWYVLWSLAKRLGVKMKYHDFDLDMETPPTTDELIAMRIHGSMIPLDEIKKHPGGKVYDVGNIRVQPGRPEQTAQFDVMPADVAAELAEALPKKEIGGFTHLMSSSRLRDFFNSNGIYVPAVRARNPTNPAFLSPEDMKALGLSNNEEIEIVSENGTIRAVAQADERLRSGVVTISHGWGDLPDEENKHDNGVCINPLISDNKHVERVNAMPRMSAIPVNIRRVASA